MATTGKTILVTGATGTQGGATARRLLARGWQVRALTRDPIKTEAQTLAGTGAEVVQGDLADRPSLDRALQGIYGVFSVGNFWEHGYEGEVRHGKNLADAAKAAGVEHFVYTSVGGAERNTGIPHFDSKREVEHYINQLGLPATFLRPVFFMDNWAKFSRPQLQDSILTISMALRPDKTLQMIAADDIGAFAALAFENPQEYIGKEIELAGDELTLPEVAEIWSRESGQPVRFVPMPLEQVRNYDPESAKMLEWFNDTGYQADIPALRAVYPQLKTFETWLRTSGVATEAVPV